jgi:hypothetical protein
LFRIEVCPWHSSVAALKLSMKHVFLFPYLC